MNNRFIGFCLVVLIIIGVGYYVSSPSSEMEKGPIKIGFIDPLTGDAASIGESMKNATALAVEEVNNAGGINGRQVEVIYEDGKCSGPVAASAAQKLISIDKVKFIIGGGCSGETLGAAPIAESAKVILISPVSSSPDISKAGDYIFRNFASDSSSGKKIAETMIKDGYKKVAVISEQSDYAQGLRNVFEKRFTELGGTLAMSETYNTNTRDFRTLLAKVKSVSAEALYLVPQTPQAGEILLNQIKEAGIKLPKYSNELIVTGSFLKSGISEGVVYAEPYFDQTSPESKKLFDKYTAKYKTIDSNTPPLYIASGYDTTKLLLSMIEKYGEDADKVKGGLYKVKDYPGIVGPINFDQNGDEIIEYIVKVVKGGKVVNVN